MKFAINNSKVRTLSTAFALLAISVPSAFAAITDIECSIASVGTDEKPGEILIKNKPVPDKAPSGRADWTVVDLDGSKGMAIVCEHQDKFGLSCTFIPGIRDKRGKYQFDNDSLLHLYGHFGIGRGGKKGYDVECASESLVADFYRYAAKVTAPAPVAARSLTRDELEFCSRLDDHGSSSLSDYRRYCAPFLKILPRALTKAELDYCEQQYGSRWDNRLNCTKEVVGQ